MNCRYCLCYLRGT